MLRHWEQLLEEMSWEMFRKRYFEGRGKEVSVQREFCRLQRSSVTEAEYVKGMGKE